MNTQPEALRLAEYWTKRANDLQTWVDENDYVEFGYRPEGLKREQADQRRTATELRRLHALNAELLEALKNLYTATYHLGACPGTVEEARSAIAKAEGEQA